MNYKILFLSLGLSLVLINVNAEENLDKFEKSTGGSNAFFNEAPSFSYSDFTSRSSKKNWLKDKSFNGSVQFFRESFSGNVNIEHGSVKCMQTSVDGKLYIDKGDLFSKQTTIHEIEIDEGSVNIDETGVHGDMIIKHGNARIDRSHIGSMKVNGYVDAANSRIGSIIVTKEARFSECEIRSIIVPTHASERIIRLKDDSKVKEIIFSSKEGSVYISNIKKEKFPKVTNGKIIIGE